MRLLPTSLGCMLLVVLTTASGMAQPVESIPAAPAGSVPMLAPGPGGVYPLPSALDTPPGGIPWALDTSSPIPREPGLRTPYTGESTYIDPACSNWKDRTSYAVRLEAIGYKLDRAINRPVLLALEGADLVTVLTTGNLDYNIQPGPRLTVGYDSSPEEGTKIEASYWGVYDWLVDRTVTSSGSNLFLPDPFGTTPDRTVGTTTNPNNYFAANVVSFHTEAQINSLEATLIYSENNSPLSFLGGIRFIRFDEAFRITAQRGPAYVSHYNVETDNNLFGIQGGMRTYRSVGPWELTSSAKFGAYAGTDGQHTYVTDWNDSVTVRDVHPSNTAFSYSFDATIALSYEVRKNFRLTGSYNALWVANIARASDNLDFSARPDSSSQLNRNGTAFLHGASLGAETRW